MNEESKVIRNVAFCPHCGNRAPQKLVYRQRYRGVWFSVNGDVSKEEDSELPGPTYYYVVVCETCNEVLVYHSVGVPASHFSEADLVYPEPGELHYSVPDVVANCYKEAARIKNLAPNAFAVQIRRALEALCEDRGVNERTLARSLNVLAERGEIPATLAEMTDILRLLGNIGAHAADQSVKPGHVHVMDDFFKAVVEYVYVAPYKLQEFRKKLERFRRQPPHTDESN